MLQPFVLALIAVLAAVTTAPAGEVATAVRLERVTTAVPWPRGLAWVDGDLVVLARGRHRRAGGLDPAIPDHAGTIFRVDVNVAEPVVPGEPVGTAVSGNAEVLAAPSAPLRLHDGGTEPLAATTIDRPYCTLVYDAPSRNLFICGYAGVDLPDGGFRKNATDSIHRFDLRDRRWHVVEMHDGEIVPETELGDVVSNAHYPHHDPATSPPPHGWVNGANGACVAGSFLYVAAKDNHLVVQYDLDDIRRDPAAGPPASRPVLASRTRVHVGDRERDMELLGPSALAARDGYLYVGYRTSSVVVRFPLTAAGNVVEDAPGELIAVFAPWEAERGRSADLVDLAFDDDGALYVSCAARGRVWRVGVPDPRRPFDGDDRGGRTTTSPPFVDLPALTGRAIRCGNILFDEGGRLYVCSGNYEAGTRLGGVIYRATGAVGNNCAQ